MRGDGTNWRIQALPATAPKPTHITGVAFDGRTPLLATTDGLYVGEASGDAYVRDDDLRARMTAAGLPAAVRTVATVADGGIAVDGRFVRDSAATPWRPTAAPLDLHPYALAAYRDPDGAVRSIVSATSEATPLPEPFDPEDDDGGRRTRRPSSRDRPCTRRPRPTRWCCARARTGGSTWTARASSGREAVTYRT